MGPFMRGRPGPSYTTNRNCTPNFRLPLAIDNRAGEAADPPWIKRSDLDFEGFRLISWSWHDARHACGVKTIGIDADLQRHAGLQIVDRELSIGILNRTPLTYRPRIPPCGSSGRRSGEVSSRTRNFVTASLVAALTTRPRMIAVGGSLMSASCGSSSGSFVSWIRE